MQTEDMTGVRIFVLDEALSAFEVRYDENKIPQLENEHRSKIEKIASAKYDGGFTEQDGSVHVTLADID
jgi:hypothetical protein